MYRWFVGKKILFNWPKGIGWCVGTIKERNTDARRTMKTSVGVEKANFFVHYECDDETVKHVLKLDGYDGDEEECWVLLELTPAAAANAAAAEEADEA